MFASGKTTPIAEYTDSVSMKLFDEFLFAMEKLLLIQSVCAVYTLCVHMGLKHFLTRHDHHLT